MNTADAIAKMKYEEKGYEDPRRREGINYFNEEEALFEMLYDYIEDGITKSNFIEVLMTVDRIKNKGFNKQTIVKIIQNMDGGFYD